MAVFRLALGLRTNRVHGSEAESHIVHLVFGIYDSVLLVSHA